MKEVIVSKSSKDDAHSAFDWYEEQKDGLGDAFTDELEKVLQLISKHPGRYRELEKGIRSAKLKRFPYLVYFFEDKETIHVIAILHEKRHPDVWKNRS